MKINIFKKKEIEKFYNLGANSEQILEDIVYLCAELTSDIIHTKRDTFQTDNVIKSAATLIVAFKLFEGIRLEEGRSSGLDVIVEEVAEHIKTQAEDNNYISFIPDCSDNGWY